VSYRKLLKIKAFDSTTAQRLNYNNDLCTNLDNENIRFRRGECEVPLLTQVQQAEGSIRDVLPQPVDSEFTSVADESNFNTTTDVARGRRREEGVALPVLVAALHTQASSQSAAEPAPARRISTSSFSTLSAKDSRSACFALQWNIRGLRANIDELKLLIVDHDPCIIALQETKANQTIIPSDFVGSQYTLLLESNSSHYWQHGVGLAIKEGIPFERLLIDTSLQIVVARIHTPVQATVVSIYVPPNFAHCEEISSLLDQLEGPVVLLGDFNTHHPAWGSSKTTSLGRFIAETTLDKQIVILNNGAATRIDPVTGSTSAIDLTLCSENLAHKLTWRILPDSFNSDHFPISISIPQWSSSKAARRKWLYNRADWPLYERFTTETIRPDVYWDVDTFTEKIIDAAMKSIPQTSGRVGPKSVPWWCPEVKMAIKRRRKRLRSLRRLQSSDSEYYEALARFQEARAASRKAVRKAKEQSWENFVSKISPNSTTSELWRTTNALRGRRQHRSVMLKRGNEYTDKPGEIAEELAMFYDKISATSSYPTLFQKTKKEAEINFTDISQNSNEAYNTDITLAEFLWALDKGKGNSTGSDTVGYPMLQRLPLSVKMILLQLFNKIWHKGEFPSSWRKAIIIPIPKTSCQNNGPGDFRPISPTSCMAKSFERIINRRLITELERNGRLDKRQHAFRTGRGTDTYFAELERSLPVLDEHCLIASLDLTKAYDTTWRHGILCSLKSWGICGQMLNTLKSFLSYRTFQVSVAGHLSSEHQQENGVPQGSVLSVTLFLIAMQPIFRKLPIGVDILLYADDILLTVRRLKNEGLQRMLQVAVTAVEKWAKSVGFTISASKSHIFYCSPNARREPAQDIIIDRIPVPKTNRLRILGVTLDRTLIFKPHCERVKKSCESRLRILRMIGSKLPRGHRASLLQVGSALVTAKLTYGIGLVSRGGPATLKILAPVYNKMVRFASGAFVTSPINAVMAEAGTLPFDLLTAQSLAKLAIRILGKNETNRNLPLIQRVSRTLEELIDTGIPNISLLVRQNERVWNASKPSIVWDMKKNVRAGDPPGKVRPIVQQLLETRFHRSTIVFTDGSKCEDAVGAACFNLGIANSCSLPSTCSIFSAEAFAIKMAVEIPNINNEMVILTDSASCLLALETGTSRHPWIQDIEKIAQNKPIHFCWIPGHAGINGNTEADRLAKEARRQTTIDVAIPPEDALRKIKQDLRHRWDSQWFSTRESKLREIKCDTSRWTERGNAADQRVLTRLRIGHTRLTHTFLLKKDSPPNCECCNRTIDVKHLILECRKYENERRTYNIDNSLHTALSNSVENTTRLLNFLRATRLFRKI
jgi:exonuclease III